MYDPIHPLVAELLKDLGKVLREFDVDFFLVGAIARDIRLGAHEQFRATRRTNDVDMAILMGSEDQFHNVKEALLATGDFAAHPIEPIKLLYKAAVELDLLPFGDIENEERETRLQKPRLFVMDMPGFQEVLPHAEIMELGDGVQCKISSFGRNGHV